MLGMIAQRISLGPISLLAPTGWKFFPREAVIFGRGEQRIGGLEVRLELLDSVPEPRSHAESLAMAMSIAPPVDVPNDAETVHSSVGGRFIGAVSYASGRDSVRLYYVHEHTNLLPIWYVCKRDRREEGECHREVAACDMMVASIQFAPRPAPAPAPTA
jgi:hypothetical protein